jgi:hypothetical protein
MGDPSDPINVARALNIALGNGVLREQLAINGQKRSVDSFLLYTQLLEWLYLTARMIRMRAAALAAARGLADAGITTEFSASDEDANITPFPYYKPTVAPGTRNPAIPAGRLHRTQSGHLEPAHIFSGFEGGDVDSSSNGDVASSADGGIVAASIGSDPVGTQPTQTLRQL